MKFPKDKNKKGSPIVLPDTRKMWVTCFVSGAVLWLIGLALWKQVRIDESTLFFFNASRIAYTPLVVLSQWFTSYGMAVITGIFVVYLLISQKLKYFDAPLTYYLYTICSFGLSGIAGDLLKEVFSRPRPAATYVSQILALSQSATPAIPSGHATKSIALILPFILLVPNSKNLHKVIKIVITLIASGVCLSRIVLGAHYLSDFIAGIGMALICFPFSMMFANMILRKINQEKLPILSKVWGVLLIFLIIVFMIVVSDF
ncbi:MAG: phosphatase PAP2 family protein [Chloroflexota bacterium]|nr:phosphatase PAP2 family protein [Chloroflexota bacterium]